MAIGRTDGPLGSIFQRDRGTEKGHDPIAGHLVDRALVVVDFVDEEFVDLVHDAVSLFGPELFHQARESLQVAEHDRDLFALPFNLVPL